MYVDVCSFVMIDIVGGDDLFGKESNFNDKKKEKESYLAKPKCVTLKKKNSFFFVCVRRHYPNEKKSRPARVCFFS